MYRTITTALALVAGFASIAAHADATGQMTICMAADAPRGAYLLDTLEGTDNVFYLNDHGTDDGAIAIKYVSETDGKAKKSDWMGNDCRNVGAKIVANPKGDPLPKVGTRLYKLGKYHRDDVLVVGEVTKDFTEQPKGMLKICRYGHGVRELMDGKPVDIPANTYAGACDANGERCRPIQVSGGSAKLGASASSCVTVPGVLSQGDDKPLKKGEHLLPQWSVTGFTPSITVVSDFK